jgi:hypothetical protein
MLAMMVTSCGHKSVSSAPTNITEAPTAASTPGSRPLTLFEPSASDSLHLMMSMKDARALLGA